MADEESAQLAAMQAAALKGSNASEGETHTEPRDGATSLSPRKHGEREGGKYAESQCSLGEHSAVFIRTWKWKSKLFVYCYEARRDYEELPGMPVSSARCEEVSVHRGACVHVGVRL